MLYNDKYNMKSMLYLSTCDSLLIMYRWVTYLISNSTYNLFSSNFVLISFMSYMTDYETENLLTHCLKQTEHNGRYNSIFVKQVRQTKHYLRHLLYAPPSCRQAQEPNKSPIYPHFLPSRRQVGQAPVKLAHLLSHDF